MELRGKWGRRGWGVRDVPRPTSRKASPSPLSPPLSPPSPSPLSPLSFSPLPPPLPPPLFPPSPSPLFPPSSPPLPPPSPPPPPPPLPPTSPPTIPTLSRPSPRPLPHLFPSLPPHLSPFPLSLYLKERASDLHQLDLRDVTLARAAGMQKMACGRGAREGGGTAKTGQQAGGRSVRTADIDGQ
ncbi:unnamed protein product [Closterium sp. NIES-65]|nr:unnamed protein product [Closterium sp. NIES-65]